MTDNNHPDHSESIRGTPCNNEDTFPGFVSPFSIFSDRPSTSAFANIGQIEPTHPPIEQNQRPRTLGETLGISLEMLSSPFHQNQAPSSTSPFNEFKFPANTEGKDLNSNIFSSESKESPDDIVDRELVIFRRPSSVSSGESFVDDLPDEFFEHTEEDIRKLMRSYRNEWAENQPLQTSTMRSEARHKSYSKYCRAIIQFHWVDNLIVQACFLPTEKVSALYKFIRDLQNSTCDFKLYTTPPKLFLSDTNITLIEADLVPLSKVFYHPTDISADNVLRSDILDKASEENIIKAQSVVTYWMKKSPADNSIQNSSSQRDTDTQKNLRRTDRPASNSCSVPKWLKLKIYL
ncbi:unnamed protein product [Schistosoma intercalatum]|nr:unnamed protein product [Schistosoma intercalatum]